ncbi:MAG: hypothetical protein M1290_01140 [Candidatus Thermoplasmatota archaeon]|nr:hypothetical protein [Candidatus Thermoplasmatota archaeon]
MTTYDGTEVRDRLLKPFKENLREQRENVNLLVSLHNIEFSSGREDYFEVVPNVFFSNLLYLLYVKKVTAGRDFESAKERAKVILIGALEKRKFALLSKTSILNEDEMDSIDTGRKLVLMDRAISYLENGKSEEVFCNYNVPEDP